jgi:hypothetical protein
VAAWSTALPVVQPRQPLPVYTVQFQQCALLRSVIIDGGLVKTVTAQEAAPPNKTNNWTKVSNESAVHMFNQLSVTMPYGRLMVNGVSQTKSQSSRSPYTKLNSQVDEYLIAAGNAITLSTDHTFNERSSAYALAAGTDIIFKASSHAGEKSAAALSGSANLVVYPYQLGQVGTVTALNIGVTFTNSLTFDPSGNVYSGAFKLVTPVNNAYLTTVSGGQATVCLDMHNDGTTDACWGPFSGADMAQ